MALTKYAKDTAVLANVGTKPEDRTDLTDETFKAKWDENATDWKAFFNNTASAEIDALITAIKGAGWTSESLKGLADLISTHTAATSWTAPTLQNSWVNFGSGYVEAGYTKDAHGFVHLKGLIKDGTASAGALIFTLPSGYRPAEIESFVVYSIVAGYVGSLTISSNGNITINTGANTAFSLSGIVFKAA